MVEKTCNILTYIILAALVVVAGLLFIPKIAGYETFAVISGSMEPNVPVGSIVYAKETSFENIQAGDIISFQMNANTRVTHRVEEVDKENQAFITKGDANNVKDADPVQYQQVIGKVALTIPFLGYLSMYIKTPLGIAGACAVIFVLILLNYLPDMLKKDEKSEESVENK